MGTGMPSRIVFLFIWVLITAGVAFLVARNASSSDADGLGNLIAPPILTADRQTIALSELSIQPVLSGDGAVVPDADGKHWNLEAPVMPIAQAYQLLQDPVGVKALIIGGPAGFDCPWLGLGQGGAGSEMPSSGPSGGPGGGGVTMRCRIPDDVTVVAGLRGTMVLQLAEPSQAMALPLTAVVGSSEQGQVIVVAADGSTRVRDVELGVADTFNIAITGGLAPDETVLAAPIQTDFVRPAPA